MSGLRQGSLPHPPPLLICCLHWSLRPTLSPSLPTTFAQGTFYLLSALHRTLDTLLHRQTPFFLSLLHIFPEKDQPFSLPTELVFEYLLWTGNIFLIKGMRKYWWIIQHCVKPGGDSVSGVPHPPPNGTVLEALFPAPRKGTMSNSSKELRPRNPGHPCLRFPSIPHSQDNPSGSIRKLLELTEEFQTGVEENQHAQIRGVPPHCDSKNRAGSGDSFKRGFPLMFNDAHVTCRES